MSEPCGSSPPPHIHKGLGMPQDIIFHLCARILTAGKYFYVTCSKSDLTCSPTPRQMRFGGLNLVLGENR